MKDKGGLRAIELFKEIDKDRSGKIDVNEFITALERMGIKKVNKKMAKAVIKTVDPNGDGQLEYKEILPMLKQGRKKIESNLGGTSLDSLGEGVAEGFGGATNAIGGVFAAISSSAGDASRGSIDFATMGLAEIPRLYVPSIGLPSMASISAPFDFIVAGVNDIVLNPTVDINSLPAEEAADLIWEKMRAYKKDKGCQRATELFKEIDKDRSGKIDVDEFIAALERMGIQGVTKKVAKAVIKTVDPNGDGQLEYKEILPMLKEPKKA